MTDEETNITTDPITAGTIVLYALAIGIFIFTVGTACGCLAGAMLQ